MVSQDSKDELQQKIEELQLTLNSLQKRIPPADMKIMNEVFISQTQFPDGDTRSALFQLWSDIKRELNEALKISGD